MKNFKTILTVAITAILFLGIFYPKILNPSYEQGLPVTGSPFSNLNLEAKSAIVFDYINNRPIFELNPEAQLPLASLTKIMTVITAKELMPDGNFKNLSDKINKALIISSNEAATAIAIETQNFLGPNDFVGEMNKKAEELGLNQTYFLNETGLDINDNIAGAYGSASDVIKILTYAIKNDSDIFEQTTADSDYNTNPYATSTTLLVASKTGLTDLAGGNLAIVFEAGMGRPIAIVVLGSSQEGRFTDVKKLMEATFNYLKL
ncbi:MAG: D-alanyl-D-alanine carboxypeptidase [Parcubacteria group bacterium Athens0714_24]|nr:MAG: D-alanyl-D-alanine carboxypeptidase [Parcubacteria group bacterium Athens0714_24]